MNLFMKKRNINKNIQIRVKRYMQYMQEAKLKEGSYKNNVETLSSLPFKLKNQLIIDLYEKVLKNVPILSENFSSECISEMCLLIKEHKYIPQDLIFNVHTIINF